jgi:tRNA pseudouridine55 synthase
MHGLLVLDKEPEITSRTAVNRLQRLLPKRLKLGHTGTLDPFATGVLVLCLGNATRLAEYVQAQPKQYRTQFRLGCSSDTDDCTGQISEVECVTAPSRAEVENALMRFVGTISQVPPSYSAVHVDGQRAYERVRKGREVSLEAREVQIHRIEVDRYDFPWLDLEIDSGKGTYIRSLARDLGQVLNCGGLVQSLRRTRIGPFTPDMAMREESRRGIEVALLPMLRAVEHLPELVLPDPDIQELKLGQFLKPPANANVGQEFRVHDSLGELHGVVYIHEKGELRVSKMFL